MNITTLSSRQFNQDRGKAKKAAKAGPVFITDRGRPVYVLLTFDGYKKINGKQAKITDLLAMPSLADVELEIPQWREPAKPADLL
jgi:hypothetical protein